MSQSTTKINFLKAIITGDRYIMKHIMCFHESLKEKHKKNFKKVCKTIFELNILKRPVLIYNRTTIQQSVNHIKKLKNRSDIKKYKKRIYDIFVNQGCITPSCLRAGLISIKSNDYLLHVFLRTYQDSSLNINWQHYFHDKCKRNWEQNGLLKIKK